MTRLFRSSCAAGALVVLTVVPSFAAAGGAAQPAAAPAGQSFLRVKPGPPQDHFDDLFLLPGQAPAPPRGRVRPSAEVLAQRVPAQAVSQPVIKCGTTLIPGDMSVDPKIQAPRGSRDTRHTIRGITPEICK